MATGWSPEGSNSADSWKGWPASGRVTSVSPLATACNSSSGDRVSVGCIGTPLEVAAIGGDGCRQSMRMGLGGVRLKVDMGAAAS